MPAHCKGRISVHDGVVAHGATHGKEAEGGQDAAVDELVVGAAGEQDASARPPAALHVYPTERGLIERDVDVGAKAIGLDRLPKDRCRVEPGGNDVCRIRDGNRSGRAGAACAAGEWTGAEREGKVAAADDAAATAHALG